MGKRTVWLDESFSFTLLRHFIFEFQVWGKERISYVLLFQLWCMTAWCVEVCYVHLSEDRILRTGTLCFGSCSPSILVVSQSDCGNELCLMLWYGVFI